MAGDQLTHGDAVRAGITSVAELSSVLREPCRPSAAARGVRVGPGSCKGASGNAPAAVLPAEGDGGAFTRSRPRKDEKAPAGRAAASRPHSLVRLFIIRDGRI